MLDFRSWAFEVPVLLRYSAIDTGRFEICLERSVIDRTAAQRHIPGKNGDLVRNMV